MESVESIRTLLRDARRRHVTLLSLRHGLFGLAFALAGLSLLLLLGTSLFDWWWVALLAVAAVGYSLWRVRKQRLDDYRLTQLLDQQAGTRDTISTAWHYNQHTANAAGWAVERQTREAARVAAQVHLPALLPWRWPRSTYACGSFALAAMTLLAVRYGRAEGLDLRAPLIATLADESTLTPEQKAEAKKNPTLRQRLQKQIAEMGLNLGTNESARDVAPDIQPREAAPTALANAQDQKGQGEATKKFESNGSSSQGDPQEAKGEQNPQQAQSGEKDGQQSEGGDQQDKGQQQAKNGNRNSQQENGLLSKMKDALSSLADKMRGKQGDSSQQGQQQQAQDQQGQQGQQNQQGQMQQSSQQGQQQAQMDSQGQQGQGQQQGQQGQQASANNPAQAKSGQGQQDGLKEIREAQQQAAMGKISELIGQRAKNVAGEMTLEVSSKGQSLQTGYTQRNAEHGYAAGDMQREEIALGQQEYIQRYFESIHKSSVKAAKAAEKAKGAAQ